MKHILSVAKVSKYVLIKHMTNVHATENEM